MSPCTHRALMTVEPPEEAQRAELVCGECAKIGGRWVHLRICLSCGEIGCCDSSPKRHARAHAESHQHPVVASAEPGESWRYCFADDMMV